MTDDLIPREIMTALLNNTDDFAVENVRAGRGGPFGASIHVVDLSGKENPLIVPVGGMAANAVLATGIASAHAEDQALLNTHILKEHLKAARGAATEANPDIAVLFSSSGESCPACHSKLEIVSRSLLRDNLLAPGRFIVTYGATYKDTAEIAGFNDEPYHHDMRKLPQDRMIKIVASELNEIPPPIVQIFNSFSQNAVSVLRLPDGTLFTGQNSRTDATTLTTEVSAIRSACMAAKNAGAATPWDLGKATLYTRTQDIGPLAYAECQWANVTDIVAVRDERCKSSGTQEAPGISNAEFFNVIADAHYNTAGHTLNIQRIIPFANKAQHAWRERLAAMAKPESSLYNGIKRN